MSRLSKDQDTLDTQLTMNLFMLLTTFSNVLGTVALVFYTFPYLGIIFVPLGIFYSFSAIYYRRTSVETKRLDSILRSKLYAAYAGKSHCCLTSGPLIDAWHRISHWYQYCPSIWRGGETGCVVLATSICSPIHTGQIHREDGTGS